MIRIARCGAAGLLPDRFSEVSTSSCYGIYVSISIRRTGPALFGLSILAACGGKPSQGTATPTPATTKASTTFVQPDSGETHLRNIRQLTFGGNNAESYFSRDSKQLIFQRQIHVVEGCDQEYLMNVDGSGHAARVEWPRPHDLRVLLRR